MRRFLEFEIGYQVIITTSNYGDSGCGLLRGQSKASLSHLTPANFDAVDDYISAKMEELGIPGAALVIV